MKHECVVPGVGERDTQCGLVAGEHEITQTDRIHCFLDGEEVTSRTKACCVLGGWIDLYDLNTEGRKFLRDGRPAITRRFGRVKVTVDQ